MALYLLALCLPALSYRVFASCSSGDTGCLNTAPYPHLDQGLQSDSGWGMLLRGLLFGPFEGVFAGYANPLLWLGWLCLLRGRRRAAWCCLLPAALLALQSFALYRIHWPLDEGVVKRAFLAHFRIGFFLWLGSLAMALATAGHASVRWRAPSHQPAHTSRTPVDGA